MRFRDLPQFTKAKYVIDVFPKQLNFVLNEYEKYYNVELNPDFQRGYVWNEKQQISYLEYFFKNPVSGRDIYFNLIECKGISKTGKVGLFQCIDGLQRLNSLKRFVDNEIPIYGHYFESFTDRSASTLRFHEHNLKTRKEVLKWYIDLNSCGVKHTDEEINRVKELLEKECLNEKGKQYD